MDNSMKEVRFDRYCALCKHNDIPETQDPCNECLECAMREGTCKPEKYEPSR